MQILEVVSFILLGLGVGALLPPVTARVPDREPVFSGVVPGDVLPLVGWSGTSPWPAPVVIWCQAATAVLFGALGVRFGWSFIVLPYLVLFAALVAITVIDLEHYRIPDRITFPTLGVMAVLVVIGSFAIDQTSAIIGAVGGGILFFLLLFVPHIISPKGMGFGDVKLALALGLALGWLNLVLVLGALLLASLLGVIAGLVLRAVRGEGAAFPFGPALAAGTVLAVLFSSPILDVMGR